MVCGARLEVVMVIPRSQWRRMIATPGNVLEAFRCGFDTASIAKMCGESEAMVVLMLEVGRQNEARIAASGGLRIGVRRR